MLARHRWLVCLFIGLFVLFYAVPHLPVNGTPLEMAFSLSWLCFCLLTIGANLYALLSVSPRKGQLGHQAEKQVAPEIVQRTRKLSSR